MRWLTGAALLIALVPALARADEPVRTWSSSQIEPGGQPQSWRFVDATSSGIGQSVYVYPSDPGPAVHASVQDFGAALDPPQTLGSGYYPRTDGSLLGGVVAAWWDGADVEVAELKPGDRTFGAPFAVPGASSGYSFEEPKVSVGDDGTAAVAFLEPDDTGQHVSVIVRPPRGTFGAPERVSASYDATRVDATDLVVGPNGTIVLGYAANGHAFAAVRSPDGHWAQPEQLGTQFDPAWFMPQVGVDALGNVAAAWAGWDGGDGVAPVQVSIKHPGAPFGAPHDSGIAMMDYGRIEMAVSAVGELVLVVEAQTNNPYGGTHLEGVHAVYGNLPAGKLGPPADIGPDFWASYPHVGWNSRGDVVVVWDRCCPMRLEARRRAPLSSFGPIADIAPPISFEGTRHGRWTLDADVDEFGNARMSYVDSEPDPQQVFAASDGPGIFDEPPKVPDLGDFLADVLPPLPPPPPPPVTAPQLPPIVPPIGVPAPAPLKLGLRVAIERRLQGGRHPRVTVRVSCNKPCYTRLAGKLQRIPLAPTDVVLAHGGSKRVGLVIRKRSAAQAVAAGASRLARVAVVASDRDGQVVRLTRKARVRAGRR